MGLTNFTFAAAWATWALGYVLFNQFEVAIGLDIISFNLLTMCSWLRKVHIIVLVSNFFVNRNILVQLLRRTALITSHDLLRARWLPISCV